MTEIYMYVRCVRLQFRWRQDLKVSAAYLMPTLGHGVGDDCQSDCLTNGSAYVLAIDLSVDGTDSDSDSDSYSGSSLL